MSKRFKVFHDLPLNFVAAHSASLKQDAANPIWVKQPVILIKKAEFSVKDKEGALVRNAPSPR
jgi:hypothetical protein